VQSEESLFDLAHASESLVGCRQFLPKILMLLVDCLAGYCGERNCRLAIVFAITFSWI
jgi:hypothetical protein